MDDLKDLSWQAAAASKPGISQGQTGTGPVNVNYNPIFQRQNNPFSQQTNAASKPLSNPMANSSSVSSANGDSFGDLVSFGTKKSEKMTMAQQAGKLLADPATQLLTGLKLHYRLKRLKSWRSRTKTSMTALSLSSR